MAVGPEVLEEATVGAAEDDRLALSGYKLVLSAEPSTALGAPEAGTVKLEGDESGPFTLGHPWAFVVEIPGQSPHIPSYNYHNQRSEMSRMQEQSLTATSQMMAVADQQILAP